MTSANVLKDEQTFIIHFTLMNQRCLAIRVVCDVECHLITIEPMVLESCFDIRVLGITSVFPELLLANQGFTVRFSERKKNVSVT